MVLKSKINQSFTLSNDSLGHLNQDILKPKYDRALLSPGIIHIGVGNFHRAHQAVYLDEYLNNNKDLRWGIIGVNLRQSESDNLNSLKERGGKYVLKTISTTGVIKFNEIHSIIGLYDWSKNQKEAELILNNPDIEILTMTITETGYYISGTGELNTKLDIVKNNIEGKEKTIIYSYLHRALNVRKNTCNKPITLLCCDNIRENGVMLQKTFRTYLEACNDQELIEWIEKNVTFPSCVVDRITPRAPDSLADEIKTELAIDEKCSVMAEPFIQWIIEENFIGKRPELEKVGVQFVDNVFPYEEAKILILNGGHVALSYFGALKDYTTYDQAINDPSLQEYFFKFEKEEVIPALGNEMPFDLKKYMMVIFDRFKNENIADRLERIAMDGVAKFPIFILPTIKACFEKDIVPSNAISSIASWYVFMKKIHNKKLIFDYYEPQWDWIKKFLTDDKIDDFANNTELWDDVPKKFPDFKIILKDQIIELQNKYL